MSRPGQFFIDLTVILIEPRENHKILGKHWKALAASQHFGIFLGLSVESNTDRLGKFASVSDFGQLKLCREVVIVRTLLVQRLTNGAGKPH